MWIVKGAGLGLLLFVAFVIFRFVANMRFSKAQAIGLSAVYGLTVGSTYFWLGLVCCIGLGICVLASLPVRIQP